MLYRLQSETAALLTLVYAEKEFQETSKDDSQCKSLRNDSMQYDNTYVFITQLTSKDVMLSRGD